MAKTLTEAPIATREARKRLPFGVHWRGIDPDVHLGYRRGKRGGVWLVRWRHGKGYRQGPLGTADDEIRAGTVDYPAALRAARTMVEAARAAAQAAADGPAPTVRSAVEAYIADRDARESRRAGRPVRSSAGRRLCRHVVGRNALGKRRTIPASALAEVELHRLTEGDLKAWRDGLPNALNATTQQRITNDLKAALHAACLIYRTRLELTISGIIRHGLRAGIGDDDERAPLARDNQILPDPSIARLIRAAREIDREQEWEGDLFRLVVVLAATGARFGQVARMRVADCQFAEGRLLVPASRKGRGGKISSTPIPVGADVLDALLPAVTDRRGDAWLLERWRRRQVAGSIRWERAERGPWRSASEMARPWQSIRERAGMPEVIPYALRHSSIVRGIRANLPIRLVASMHDTSTMMIERHYSKWIATGLEDMARAAVVALVPDATVQEPAT